MKTQWFEDCEPITVFISHIKCLYHYWKVSSGDYSKVVISSRSFRSWKSLLCFYFQPELKFWCLLHFGMWSFLLQIIFHSLISQCILFFIHSYSHTKILKLFTCCSEKQKYFLNWKSFNYLFSNFREFVFYCFYNYFFSIFWDNNILPLPFLLRRPSISLSSLPFQFVGLWFSFLNIYCIGIFIKFQFYLYFFFVNIVILISNLKIISKKKKYVVILFLLIVYFNDLFCDLLSFAYFRRKLLFYFCFSK